MLHNLYIQIYICFQFYIQIGCYFNVKIIYKHVIKYRPDTNLKSIKTNIYLCNEFIKFPNNLIGLNSKKYKINYNKKIESDIKVSEIINEDVKLIFNKILNEIKIGKSEFSLLLKKNILDSKVLEAIQLCHENYNKNSIELNFKDYLSIINAENIDSYLKFNFMNICRIHQIYS